MVEFELLSKSEYLVETLWVGDKSSKLKEFATIIRLSLKVEWWGKTRFQILFLILKSPAMIIKFDKFTSVFLRYFKVVWEESEYTFMIQKIVLLLKKEARRISMWLIMSFLNEKQREESLTLIYVMTLGKSLEENGSLAKMSQLGWLGTPNRGMPLGFVVLRMDLRVVHDGSWMNMMSKSWLTSRTVLIRKLLFQTFCKKFFNIIFWHHSHLNGSILS